MKNYTEETKIKLAAVEQYLEKRYGQISPEWEQSIELLGDTYDLYDECRESIKEYGVYDSMTGKKNPLISTLKDCQATIMKLQQKLGITPYDTAKIKVVESDDADLLSAITGNFDDYE